MATTESIPPGIYRIAVAPLGADVEPSFLTRHEKWVTILPPGAQPERDQEWRITHAKDGNIIIQNPSPLRPGSYLTYQGAPEKPKQGERVVYHLSEFPPNEWHVGIAPGFRHSLRVAGSELGIAVAPPKIFPPFLELAHEHQLAWRFEPLPHVEE